MMSYRRDTTETFRKYYKNMTYEIGLRKLGQNENNRIWVSFNLLY